LLLKRRNALTKNGNREGAKKIVEECVQYLQEEGVLKALNLDG
jgi:hypothetical protein